MKTTQELLRHSSPVMTLVIYAKGGHGRQTLCAGYCSQAFTSGEHCQIHCLEGFRRHVDPFGP